MPSTVTNFAVTQSLLSQSIDSNSYLDAATKAALKTRVANLAKQQDIVLDQSKVLSTTGGCAENVPNRVVTVNTGAGPNRVEFDPMTFLVPLRVDGTKGVGGFLPGTIGTSQLPQVAAEDITLQFRLAASDAFQDFDKSTVLDEVTWIQFAANVAVQLALSALPVINVHAEQV